MSGELLVAGVVVGTVIGVIPGAYLWRQTHSDDKESEEDSGCDSHHFSEYESTNLYSAEVEKQWRSTHEDDTDGWSDYKLRDMKQRARSGGKEYVDMRRIVVVFRRKKATCEHDGCNERDYIREKDDQFVIVEKNAAEDNLVV